MVTNHPGLPGTVSILALNIPHPGTPLGLEQMGQLVTLTADFVLSADSENYVVKGI